MIDLDVNDKFLIDKFFNTNGYVLDFSTSSFDVFCFESIGIKLCEKYGVSKGRALLLFLKEYPTSVSMILVKKLYEHYKLVFTDLPDNMKKPHLHNNMDTLVSKYDLHVSHNNNKITEERRVPSDKYDVFVSHATKDKLVAVNDLRNVLSSIGVNVWYDTDELQWGDNLESKITDGLNNCQFGIVVLSKTFFGRSWCEKELHSLVERQKKEKVKIILPLLLNISASEAINKYPFLIDIKMIEYTKGTEKDIALMFAKVLIRRLKNID